TAKLWLPSASAAVVCGLVQELQLPPSMRHSKVEPGSLALKLKLGVVSLEGLAGPLSTAVLGAVKSIAQVRLAGLASVLPAVSVARTSSVWLPSASAAVVCGLVQALQLPASRRHSKLEPGSLELKLKLGVVSFEGLEGL